MDGVRRLRGQRVYLAGAMDRVPDGGVMWRERVTPRLNAMGVIVMDPCHKPYEGAVEDDQSRDERRAYKRLGRLDKTREVMRPIRRMDLHMVDVSDFLVASIDVEVHACGTYEEVTWANRQKKPVLCWIQQGVVHTPDWLLAVLPPAFLFDSVNDLMGYLEYIDRSPVIETLNRWYTPKFEMLYNATVLGVLEAE